MPDRRTLESAVALASRAPSLHNSQPWKWLLGADELGLFADDDRILPATDPSGRQMVVSCGATLHHLQTALAAQRWSVVIERMPSPSDRRYLAALRFHRSDDVPDAAARLAAAIRRRRTERLPMGPPPRWQQTAALLKDVVERAGAHLDEIGDHERPALDDMSRRIEETRRTDPSYQSELDWWAGHAAYPDGIPAEALPSERPPTSIGREFPPGRATGGAGDDDRAAILLLSTGTDSRLDWLRGGEALSAVLLTCTDLGLATCPVSHLTEFTTPRTLLRGLTAGGGAPQALIRVGVRTPGDRVPATPRRPLSEILIRDHPPRS